MANAITNQAEDYLEALVDELEIPISRYEQADKSYKSLGDWLHRPESKVQHLAPDIYVQGSFRLGTVIKPISNDEQYDIDSVCVLEKLEKSDLSQADLKTLLGNEIKLYRKSRNITKVVQEGRRCWTLEYADGAQFHMDIVPSLLNGKSQRLLLESHEMDAQWADTAIAITDNEVPNYYYVTDDWPRSNPKGFAEWFHLTHGRNLRPSSRNYTQRNASGGFDRKRRGYSRLSGSHTAAVSNYDLKTPSRHNVQGRTKGKTDFDCIIYIVCPFVSRREVNRRSFALHSQAHGGKN